MEEFKKCNDRINSLAKRLIIALEDDIRIAILILLSREGPTSFRAISRKLRVSYKKLERALADLSRVGLIEIIEVRPSEEKCYRFYHISKDLSSEIKELLEGSYHLSYSAFPIKTKNSNPVSQQ